MTVENDPIPQHDAVLFLPRLRVQNANAISSPMTWGFPAISAFLGAMTALERKLGPNSGIRLLRVGVICHGHEAQITTGGYTRAFRLTRNPVEKDGGTAAIVEEGRIHLDISLVFDVQIASLHVGPEAQQALAEQVLHQLEGMRVAGGSLVPPRQGRRKRPRLALQGEVKFRELARQCLPGFALVARDDLLQSHWQALKETQPEATLLDAWLDLSRLNHRAIRPPEPDEADEPTVQWQTDSRDGWIVPIPVGYAPLTELHLAGNVAGARDRETPFRFVETVWSLGQWISPHRLQDWEQLFWEAQTEGPAQAPILYRCTNGDIANNPSQELK